jgi:soluble lytic murein transglycosylase-like protein
LPTAVPKYSEFKRRAALAVVLTVAWPYRLRAEFPAPPPAQAEEIFGRAAAAMESGDFALMSSALGELSPLDLPRAWASRADFLKAESLLRQKQFSEAALAFSLLQAESIGLAPYRDEKLGDALAGDGRQDEAIRALTAAAGQDFGGLPATARMLASLARIPGDREIAFTALLRALGYNSSDELESTIEDLARVADTIGRSDAIETAARVVLADEPAARSSPGVAASVRAAATEILRGVTPAERLKVAELENAQGRFAEALRDAPGTSAGHLLRARILKEHKRPHEAERELARVAPSDPDATTAAALLRAEIAKDRLSRSETGKIRLPWFPEPDPRRQKVLDEFAPLCAATSPPEISRPACESAAALAAAQADRASTMRFAARFRKLSPNSGAGFEPLWRFVVGALARGDFGEALAELDPLRDAYPEISLRRRIDYWRARCLEKLGREDESSAILREIASADPADVYAELATGFSSLCTPSPDTGAPIDAGDFARIDELLRLRFYNVAAAETRRLPESRGRHLRLALADFGRGDFLGAVSEVKRAFPEMGTAEEARVPEEWRRLYYPLAGDATVREGAREFGVDESLLLAVVRQESGFNPRARSRAGAVGLTQLLPSTARSLSRSILKKRFRTAFLLDPGINVRLGASYLRQLLDEFGDDPILALAAYNGGEARVEAVRNLDPRPPRDLLLEMIPAHESRDYVRRILLYRNSYRELYPPVR